MKKPANKYFDNFRFVFHIGQSEKKSILLTELASINIYETKSLKFKDFSNAFIALLEEVKQHIKLNEVLQYNKFCYPTFKINMEFLNKDNELINEQLQTPLSILYTFNEESIRHTIAKSFVLFTDKYQKQISVKKKVA